MVMVFLLFLSCFTAEKNKSESLGLPSCFINTQKINPQWSPEPFFSRKFEAGSIVLIAEHHEQALQIEDLSQAIDVVSQENTAVSFAAEWLPAVSTEKMNQLVLNEKWDQELWLSIIESKDYIRPLQISEYVIPVKKIWSLNQNRQKPIQLFGLAPNCSFQHKDKKQVLGCLMEREDFMEKQVREHFSSSEEGVLIVSLGFRHAQLITTDIENNIPLGKRLSDYKTISILQNGFGEDGRSLCNGIFDRLNQEVILPLKEADLSVLKTSCISNDSYHKIVPLKEAYTHVWAGPYEWKKGRYLDLDKMNAASLNKWSAFQSSLMKFPDLGNNPTIWENWMEKNFVQVQPQEQNNFDCSKMNVVNTP